MQPRCGCGALAEYMVYEFEQPHCKNCMLEAIECEVSVTVRKPVDWVSDSEWRNYRDWVRD